MLKGVGMDKMVTTHPRECNCLPTQMLKYNVIDSNFAHEKYTVSIENSI